MSIGLLRNVTRAGLFKHPDKGFTLIELLISITIVSVILVIIQVALRIGVRAWEKGERDIDVNQRQQIVLSLMKQQLSSVCWTEIKKGENDPYYFGGDIDAVELISSVSIIPGNEFGKVYAAYRIVPGQEDSLTLEVAEQSLAKISPDTRLYEPQDDEFQELISDAYDMSFKFLSQADDGEGQWEDHFVPDGENGLPAAIRFTLRMTEKNLPVSIIIRVVAEQDMLQGTGNGKGLQ